MRTLLRLLAACTVLVIMIASGVVAAAAQSNTDVTGAADFRNPPMLSSGSYEDTLVTGETVWYALVYRNDTPYRFEASVVDGDSNELDVVTTLISPTLNKVDSASGVLEAAGASARGAHTDLWYLTVELKTTGPVGVPHRLLLNIDGVEDTSLSACTRVPGCTFDDDLAALDAQVAELTPQLKEALDKPTTELAEREIESLESFLAAAESQSADAQAQLSDAEARMAELCAPRSTCATFPEPGGKTPTWAWLLGVGPFAWGLHRLVNRVRSPKEQTKPKHSKPVAYTPRGIRPADKS